MPAGDWIVDADADDEAALAVLELDRIWNCFGIADLSPPFRQHVQIAIARSSEDVPAMLFQLRSPALKVISAWGSPPGVELLLAIRDTPATTYIQSLPAHAAAFEHRYGFTTTWTELIRMHVGPDTFVAPRAGSDRGRRVAALTAGDRSELHRFYGPLARNDFPDHQLEHGAFFGIREDAQIVAVAGTHVVSPDRSIAVIGGVQTREDRRRQGLARLVTATLTQHLFELGCHDVVLNVVRAHAGAIALYRGLGFREHVRFFSAPGERSATADASGLPSVAAAAESPDQQEPTP